jgi:hypothetical protein
MAMMVLRAVPVLTALMVGMVRLVSAVLWALQVLPARKVHRGNGVSEAPPVRTDPMVKMVRMAVLWCLCTVLRVA